MDRQHIGAAEQLNPRHVRRLCSLGGFGGQVCAPCDDIHAEGRPDPRHPGTDPAQAEHTEHCTAELATDRGLPTAGAHRQVLIDYPPGRGQDKRPGEFDRGFDVAAGGAHIDPALLGGRDIDRRVERSRERDHLQIREALDDVARQRCPLAHDAHHVEGRESFDESTWIGEALMENGDVGTGGDR